MTRNGFEIRGNHRPSIFLQKDLIFCTRIHIIKQNSLPKTVVFPYLAIYQNTGCRKAVSATGGGKANRITENNFKFVQENSP